MSRHDDKAAWMRTLVLGLIAVGFLADACFCFVPKVAAMMSSAEVVVVKTPTPTVPVAVEEPALIEYPPKELSVLEPVACGCTIAVEAPRVTRAEPRPVAHARRAASITQTPLAAAAPALPLDRAYD